MESQKVISPEIASAIQIALLSGGFDESSKREVLKLLAAAENYQITHPIESYQPIKYTKSGSHHQLGFHTSERYGRAIFGGNQSGKTQSGSFEASFHFTGVYPDWYPKALRLKHKNIGRIMAVDFPKYVSEVIEPALRKSIPSRLIEEWKKNTQGYLSRAISKTGSRFDIVTHDMQTKSLEGWQGDWAWFDEPCPRDKFIAITRGLIRRKGRWWLTCTPLEEPWMYDQIYTNPDIFVITIDIRDNPYLPEEEIVKFESELTEDEKEARLHGKFMHLSGLVYKTFDPSIHVKNQNIGIPSEWPRWMVCDPHDRRPFAMMWFAVDPLNRVWIYDEWPDGWFHEMRSSGKSVRDYTQIIREKEGNQKIYRRIIDGRACQAVKIGSERQETLLEMFDSCGLYPPFETSYITQTLSASDPGHIRVNEYLRKSPVTDEPSLFVLSNCRNMIYAFQHNVWQESRNSMVVRETQGQFAKDFLDLIRYGLMDDPHWMEQSDRQDSFSQPKWVERNLAEMDL